MTDETRGKTRRHPVEMERDRRYLVRLIKTQASCITFTAMLGVIVLLGVFEVPPRNPRLREFVIGALVTVAGLLFWADRAIPEVSRRVFGGPDEDEGQG
jgi:hypothetical protein